MSLTATLTFWLPLLRTAVRAGCSGVGVVMDAFSARRQWPRSTKVRRARGDAELAHRLGHCRHRLAHLARPDGADAADAKGFDLRQLARVEDEAARLHRLVERLELVVRIAGRME